MRFFPSLQTVQIEVLQKSCCVVAGSVRAEGCCMCLRGMQCVHDTFAAVSCKSIPISFDMSACLFARLSAGSTSYIAAERIYVKFDEWKF